MRMIALRHGGFSIRVNARVLVVNCILAALLLAISAASLMSGAYPLDAAQVYHGLMGESEGIERLVLIENRLPRLLVGMGAGFALGLAGETVQTLLRNPLASPDVIGFSAGASAGAILTIAVTGVTSFILPGAVIGGFLSAALVLGLAWDKGLDPMRVVLIGIGVTLTLGVCSDILMTVVDLNAAADFAKWLIGMLDSRSWQDVGLLWTALIVLLPMMLYKEFALSRLVLFDDMATAIGMRLDYERCFALALALCLVASAVAVAGPLPFVAFVAGPIAHGLNGAARPSLLAAGLTGALVTLGADLIARSLPDGIMLPTGVFTALLGAPILIWILINRSRKAQP